MFSSSLLSPYFIHSSSVQTLFSHRRHSLVDAKSFVSMLTIAKERESGFHCPPIHVGFILPGALVNSLLPPSLVFLYIPHSSIEPGAHLLGTVRMFLMGRKNAGSNNIDADEGETTIGAVRTTKQTIQPIFFFSRPRDENATVAMAQIEFPTGQGSHGSPYILTH